MSYNNYMYAIDRSDEYLAHYGIKGMKWGVRKAIETGNGKKLDRAYRKAAKKLAKLEKRADSGSKYARRAAVLGAGAAVAGGLAGIGPRKATAKSVAAANKYLGGGAAAKIARLDAGKNVINTLNGRGNALTAAANANKYLGGNAATKIGRLNAGISAQNAINKGVSSTVSNANKYLGGNAATKIGRLDTGKSVMKNGISNNTVARLGAAALGAGLAGAAGYNAYRAATTKRAARKAAEFKSEMNKAFAGTKYANGGGNKSSGNRKRRRR